MEEHELIIVGGGMVGLSLAAVLAANSEHMALSSIALVDQHPFLPSASTNQRFSAINIASEQFLKDAGAWARIVELGAISPYRKMVVWDATGQGEIEFDSCDLGRPHLGHIVANQTIQSALHEQISTQPAIKLICPAKTEILREARDLMELVLAFDRTLCSKLIVGADGPNSWLRDQANMAITQWPYQQYSLTATAKTEKPHHQTAWQRFLPAGPLAFLPLLDPTQCSIVWTSSEEQARQLCGAPEKEFNQKLAEAFDWRLGEVTVLGERAIFPLQMRHAKRYIKPRLALIGDAAHTLHPLAGQGVNLGFADAKCLVDILSQATQSGQNIGELTLLKRYERSRKVENWEMIAAVEGLKRLFSNDSIPLSMLRNFGLKLTNQSPLIKRAIMRHAAGV